MSSLRIIHRGTEGTTLTGVRVDGAEADTLRACGWRYSRRRAKWYVPSSRDRAPRRDLIVRTEDALTRAGHVVHVELEVRPQLVEDLTNWRAARTSPRDAARRIERLQRRLRVTARDLAGYRNHLGVTFPPARGAERDELLDEREQLSGRLRYWQAVERAQLNDAGVPRVDRRAVTRGDLVEHRGRWHTVIRTNRKTVSLRSDSGGNWPETVPYHQLTGHRLQNP